MWVRISSSDEDSFTLVAAWGASVSNFALLTSSKNSLNGLIAMTNILSILLWVSSSPPSPCEEEQADRSVAQIQRDTRLEITVFLIFWGAINATQGARGSYRQPRSVASSQLKTGRYDDSAFQLFTPSHGPCQT